MSKASRILCRVVTALLALTVLPNLYFNGLVYFEIDGGLPALLGDTLSISQFGPGGIWQDLLRGGRGGSQTLHELLPLLRPAMVAGALLALAALCLVAVAVIAAVSNKKIPLLFLCGAGIVCVIGAYISFGRFANAVTSPDFHILGVFGENILVSLIGSILNPTVVTLHLTSGVSMTLVILVAVIVWNLAFWVTTPKTSPKSSPKPSATPKATEGKRV
jgi:hypothetical protein